MDTRRFRNHPPSEALAQVRWLGWVMIMMFVLVQTATGGTPSGERSEQLKSQLGPYVDASPPMQIPLQAAVPQPRAEALLASASSGAEGMQSR